MKTRKNISSDLTNSEEKLIKVMQLLGDKTRYKMFKLVMSNQEMCVTEIAEKLGVTLSAVSQHFKQFELLGLVNKERMGQKICYVLENDNDIVDDLVNILNKRKSENILSFWRKR